jgi:hypothetical protein
MSVFLKSCWAMLTPFKEESLPLMYTQHDDLEACENSENSDSTDCIMLVCEIPELPASRFQHTRSTHA